VSAIEKYREDALDEAVRFSEALERIACYGDESAGAFLDRTGSYAAFDEPGSVQIAREALGAPQ
jgi:hypothetical protein